MIKCIFLENDQMQYEIDVNRLRKDMKDRYGTAMFNGFPMAVMDLSKIEKASDQELVDLAQKQGIDLIKYLI